MATKELTNGTPIKLILCFMFPIFIGNLFQQLYNLADTLIVGRFLGIKSLAAVGATGPLIFLIISFIFASTQGFSVVTAQNFGARNYPLIKKSLAASLILSACLTLVLTVISTPFTYQLLAFLKTPSDIIDLSTQYLFIMFAGIFATVFYNLSANIIRALGDSKTPLYFLIFSTMANIFLDLLFVIKFHWGVQGAGLATVVSEGIATIFCMSFMFYKFPILRLKKEDWQISTDFLYEHLRVGIPMGFQMSVLGLGIIAVQFILNTLGSVAVAAFTTAMVVDQFFGQTYSAIGATMAVYTAQNFGAKQFKRIKEGAKSAMLLVGIITLIAITVISLYSAQIISLFMSEVNPEVVRLAQQYLHIIMIFFVFLGTLMVFRNILQGMGNVGIPLISGFAELIARGGCALAFGHLLGFFGVCIATPLAWVTASVVLFVGYRFSLIKNAKNRRITVNQKL